MIKGGPLD